MVVARGDLSLPFGRASYALRLTLSTTEVLNSRIRLNLRLNYSIISKGLVIGQKNDSRPHHRQRRQVRVITTRSGGSVVYGDFRSH